MRDSLLDSYITKTIAIDLDGTLTDRSENLTCVGPLKSGAVNAVKYFVSRGFVVFIYTARGDLRPVYEFIRKSPLSNLVEITNAKPPCVMYIDDRGYRFQGDWFQTMKDVKEILNKDHKIVI